MYNACSHVAYHSESVLCREDESGIQFSKFDIHRSINIVIDFWVLNRNSLFRQVYARVCERGARSAVQLHWALLAIRVTKVEPNRIGSPRKKNRSRLPLNGFSNIFFWFCMKFDEKKYGAISKDVPCVVRPGQKKFFCGCVLKAETYLDRFSGARTFRLYILLYSCDNYFSICDVIFISQFA